MKNNKQNKRASEGNGNANTIESQAKLKAGTHFKASDIAEGMAVDNVLGHGRVNNSSKSMEQAAERFDAATSLILSANDRVLNEAIRTEKQSKKACASVKSTVNEIRDQLIKVDSILGDNVEYKIQQLERVAAALKIISELSGDSKTMSIVSAMVNKG